MRERSGRSLNSMRLRWAIAAKYSLRDRVERGAVAESDPLDGVGDEGRHHAGTWGAIIYGSMRRSAQGEARCGRSMVNWKLVLGVYQTRENQ